MKRFFQRETALDITLPSLGTISKVTLSPHNGIAGHTVEFIALDGSVSLSLKVAEAEVDETNETLTWKVESQPWQSGDKLMLRID